MRSSPLSLGALQRSVLYFFRYILIENLRIEDGLQCQRRKKGLHHLHREGAFDGVLPFVLGSQIALRRISSSDVIVLAMKA
jgi:hypothetical protein